MRINKSVKTSSVPVFTHEGAVASKIPALLELRRSVLATMLWEDSFYESGVQIAERIQSLISKVPAEDVARLAIEVREKGKLRHVPLLIVREMARTDSHKHLVAKTLERIIQRPDEICEFIKIYWLNGKQPLSNQVKKGLAMAFTKFDEYQLAKWS
jgi:hypothetical protein